MEWQPIETAPRDGDEFLAYGDEIGWQVVDYEPTKRDPAWCWQVTDGVAYHHTAFTHWMPLPDPPNPSEQNTTKLSRERSSPLPKAQY